jgi:hypothetical protein
MSLVNAVQPVHPAEVQRDMLDEQNPATGLRLSLQLGTTPGGRQISADIPLRDRTGAFARMKLRN